MLVSFPKGFMTETGFLFVDNVDCFVIEDPIMVLTEYLPEIYFYGDFAFRFAIKFYHGVLSQLKVNGEIVVVFSFLSRGLHW